METIATGSDLVRAPASVLICGAGPVGLTLAAELARYGVPVRIVDKAVKPTDKSKALVLWSRTLELLERGIGAERGVEMTRIELRDDGIEATLTHDDGCEERPQPTG